MKYIMLIAMLSLMLLVSGCADQAPTQAPTETVNGFVSAYAASDYDECYKFMSEKYRSKNDLVEFINICKTTAYENKYQFVELTNDYIDEDTAVVDVTYNVAITTSTLSLGLDETTTVETYGAGLKLINDKGAWKFNDFPEELT